MAKMTVHAPDLVEKKAILCRLAYDINFGCMICNGISIFI